MKSAVVAVRKRHPTAAPSRHTRWHSPFATRTAFETADGPSPTEFTARTCAIAQRVREEPRSKDKAQGRELTAAATMQSSHAHPHRPRRSKTRPWSSLGFWRPEFRCLQSSMRPPHPLQVLHPLSTHLVTMIRVQCAQPFIISHSVSPLFLSFFLSIPVSNITPHA
jgi:hypothetical protein